jgi:hypothetical protein
VQRSINGLHVNSALTVAGHDRARNLLVIARASVGPVAVEASVRPYRPSRRRERRPLGGNLARPSESAVPRANAQSSHVGSDRIPDAPARVGHMFPEDHARRRRQPAGGPAGDSACTTTRQPQRRRSSSTSRPLTPRIRPCMDFDARPVLLNRCSHRLVWVRNWRTNRRPPPTPASDGVVLCQRSLPVPLNLVSRRVLATEVCPVGYRPAEIQPVGRRKVWTTSRTEPLISRLGAEGVTPSAYARDKARWHERQTSMANDRRHLRIKERSRLRRIDNLAQISDGATPCWPSGDSSQASGCYGKYQ